MPSPYPAGVPLEVCLLFEELSLQMWEAGLDHYSARAVLHQIRWQHDLARGNRTFKANNNWTPALARWAMDNNPDLKGFFFLRELGKNHHQP